MAEKAKSPKTPKAKAPKSTVSKPAAAPKATKAPKTGKAPKPGKAKLKAVKTAARSKSKPNPLETHGESFHVLLAPLPALIHSAKPHPSQPAVEFSSFADAKERAIDHLIELIEEAERRLHVLRRATRHEEHRH